MLVCIVGNTITMSHSGGMTVDNNVRLGWISVSAVLDQVSEGTNLVTLQDARMVLTSKHSVVGLSLCMGSEDATSCASYALLTTHNAGGVMNVLSPTVLRGVIADNACGGMHRSASVIGNVLCEMMGVIVP